MEKLANIEIPQWVLKIKLADVATGKLFAVHSLSVLINCFKTGIIESPSDGTLCYKFGLIEGKHYTRISIEFYNDGEPNSLRILSINMDDTTDNLYYRLYVMYGEDPLAVFSETVETKLDELLIFELNMNW